MPIGRGMRCSMSLRLISGARRSGSRPPEPERGRKEHIDDTFQRMVIQDHVDRGGIVRLAK